MEKRAAAFIVLLLSVILTACAFDLVHVKQLPVNLDTTQISKGSFVIEREETVALGTGYTRTVKAGTRWDYVGRTEKGDVYRTKDQVLTVEASNIHEAYMVVEGEKLVGFYLPVERTFSPLSDPATLKMKHVNGI
jgi:hypothetical protein